MTYKIQIDDVVRDATADEAAAIDARNAAAAAEQQAATVAAAARASAIAKLAGLGLTDDEIAALVG
jgi:biotin carboxylase